MKIAVLVKSVPDTASELQVTPDGKSVATAQLKHVMSPYDEHAVEQAIRLKESHGAEVVVVSAGPPESKETIRTALAMGADAGVWADTGQAAGLTAPGTARLLAAVIKEIAPDLVFAGKQAVDDDGAQVPERVAELLGMAHASVITRFELSGSTAEVDREVEGGQITLEVPLPALFTMQKGINTPRYPTLPNIMKAKKKEIRESRPEQSGAATGGLEVLGMSLPRQQRLCKVIDGDGGERAKTLVRILMEDEKVV